MHGRARLRPWEIRKCTLSEIAMYLDDDDDRKPRAPVGSTPIGSHEEMVERAKYWRSLTPRQRLEKIREEMR